MALKQIMLAKKIEGKEREIENLRNLTKQFEKEKRNWRPRSAKLRQKRSREQSRKRLTNIPRKEKLMTIR